jgi:hypothetical protein
MEGDHVVNPPIWYSCVASFLLLSAGIALLSLHEVVCHTCLHLSRLNLNVCNCYVYRWWARHTAKVHTEHGLCSDAQRFVSPKHECFSSETKEAQPAALNLQPSSSPAPSLALSQGSSPGPRPAAKALRPCWSTCFMLLMWLAGPLHVFAVTIEGQSAIIAVERCL